MDIILVSDHGDAEEVPTVIVHADGDLVKLWECGAGYAEHAQHAEEGKELGLELAERQPFAPLDE
jgi:hypothetical protein